MADYLIEQYNEKMQAIQDREAKKLAGALEIYTCATFAVTEAAALERVEAGAALAAAMSQRDHEYHNGRPQPVEPEKPNAAEPNVLPFVAPPRTDVEDEDERAEA